MMSDVACSSCECKEGSYKTFCNDSAVSTALSNCSRDDDHPTVLTLSQPRFDVDNNCNDVSFRSSKPFDHHDHNSTIIPIADNVRATKKRDIIAVHSHSDPLTSRRVDMVILNTVTSIDLTPRSAVVLIADDVTTAVTTSTAAAQMITAASCHSAATAIRDRESIPNCEHLIDDERIEVGGSCYDDPTTNDKSFRRASITQKRSSDTAGTGTHISPSRSSSSSARSSSYSSYRMTSMSCCSSDLNCDNDDVDDAPPCRRTIHRSHKFNNKHASKVSNKFLSRHISRQRIGRDEHYIIPAMRDKMRCNSNDEYNTSLSRKKTRDGRHITDCVRSTATAERGDHRMFSDLILSWWERDGDCKDAKVAHVDKIDSFCSEDRERLILLTSLWRQDTVLEPNMFPCE